MVVQVVFLGTGAAVPYRGGANCAYIIRASRTVILIDCGPAILQQLDAAQISPGEITHVFITHRHGDHALGYPMLALWWALKLPPDAPLPTLLASELTFRSLDGLLDNSYGDDHVAGRARQSPRVAVPSAEPGLATLADGVTLRTYPMRHSAWAPGLGGRFEITDTDLPNGRGRARRAKAKAVTLAFTGDTAPTDAIVDLARDADLLVHDAGVSATLTPDTPEGAHGHSSAAAAGALAQRAGARRLALVHLDADHVDARREGVYLAEASRVFDGAVSVPVPGLTLEF